MDRSEWVRLMLEAIPHGPDEPCTCDGTALDGTPCGACAGHEVGCTCDIDWEKVHSLQEVRSDV